MRILAFVSLWYLISESTSECPLAWNNLNCICYGNISNPEVSCTASSTSELILLSNINRHNLTTLYLRLDEFTVLPSSVLHYDNLTTLLINGIVLAAVHEDAFADLKESLSSLILQYSRFRKIPVSAISRLHKIENLDMERNKIDSLNESLRSIPLRILNLRYNRISEIGRNILPESLTKLDLSDNKLKSLNNALNGNLIDLDISNNYLKSLDGVLNEVPKLNVLMARDNLIENIDHCFSRVPQLNTIELDFNNIKEIHNGLRGLMYLRKLTLLCNELEVIDREAFVDLKALGTLSLRANSLRYLDPDLFSCLINLQHLDISSNKLRDLNFLVSRNALTNQAPDVHNICSFRHNTTLLSLDMERSGIRCDKKARRAIGYLASKGVKIEGNPCRRRG